MASFLKPMIVLEPDPVEVSGQTSSWLSENIYLAAAIVLIILMLALAVTIILLCRRRRERTASAEEGRRSDRGRSGSASAGYDRRVSAAGGYGAYAADAADHGKKGRASAERVRDTAGTAAYRSKRTGNREPRTQYERTEAYRQPRYRLQSYREPETGNVVYGLRGYENPNYRRMIYGMPETVEPSHREPSYRGWKKMDNISRGGSDSAKRHDSRSNGISRKLMQLIIRFDGKEQMVEKYIRGGDRIILGRGRQCDVDVTMGSSSSKGRQISREHAIIRIRSDAMTVTNQSSLNQTFLNNEPVQFETLVKSGDIIRIGSAKIRLNVV